MNILTIPAQEVMTIFQIPKWPITFLFPGLIIGLSVSLAFFICGFIALAVLAAHLYHQLKNKDKEARDDDGRKSSTSTRHYYAENYYDSIKWFYCINYINQKKKNLETYVRMSGKPTYVISNQDIAACNINDKSW